MKTLVVVVLAIFAMSALEDVDAASKSYRSKSYSSSSVSKYQRKKVSATTIQQTKKAAYTKAQSNKSATSSSYSKATNSSTSYKATPAKSVTSTTAYSSNAVTSKPMTTGNVTKTKYVTENHYHGGSTSGGLDLLTTFLVVDALTDNTDDRLDDIERKIEQSPPSAGASSATPVASAAEPTLSYSSDEGKSSNNKLTYYGGSESGLYTELCRSDKGLKVIGKEYGLTIDCHLSTGGNENLRRGALGEAALWTAQADSVYYFKHTRPAISASEYPLYQEPFLLIASSNANIDGLSDIDADTTIYVVGGAADSWRILSSFAKDDSFLEFGGSADYSKAEVVEIQDWETALSATAIDPDSVLFTVMSVDAQRIQSLVTDNTRGLKLLPVDDDRFLSISDRGNRIYSECEIDSRKAGDLIPKSFWSSSSVETLCVDALLMVDNNWVQKHTSDVNRRLSFTVADFLDVTRQRYAN